LRAFGKSNSTKVFQINILVAAKLARVHANQRHETRHETQEAVRENMEVITPALLNGESAFGMK